MKNPYAMMAEDDLVEQMLHPVDDLRQLYDRSKNVELQPGEKQALDNAVGQYCLFKPVYYQEQLEHKLMRLKQIDKLNWETDALKNARNYAR